MDKITAWVKQHKKWSAAIVVVALVGVAGAAGSGGSSTKKDAAPSTAPSVSVAATLSERPSPTSSPSPSPSPSPKVSKNPLATSDNKLACRTARRKVGDKGAVFGQFSDGTATASDAESAAKSLQGGLSDAASYSTGAISTNLTAASVAYARVRVGLVESDLAAVKRGVKDSSAALNALTALCSSIDA